MCFFLFFKFLLIFLLLNKCNACICWSSSSIQRHDAKRCSKIANSCSFHLRWMEFPRNSWCSLHSTYTNELCLRYGNSVLDRSNSQLHNCVICRVCPGPTARTSPQERVQDCMLHHHYHHHRYKLQFYFQFQCSSTNFIYLFFALSAKKLHLLSDGMG